MIFTLQSGKFEICEMIHMSLNPSPFGVIMLGMSSVSELITYVSCESAQSQVSFVRCCFLQENVIVVNASKIIINCRFISFKLWLTARGFCRRTVDRGLVWSTDFLKLRLQVNCGHVWRTKLSGDMSRRLQKTQVSGCLKIIN